ncbi:hypothetical protein [Micromonospora sp. NBC_01813]|uniref:hypothetical protein n=1 Tax=Micromonospora sp. NBC_01813 TaxID=2975988 RepID=UPI002DD8427E|nr:hypothetical protein [Micromonospora sp. NBC_01813]WSA08699.1 hypothetical protein OG958_31770 [Micromonospora sp. NBC_01813]
MTQQPAHPLHALLHRAAAGEFPPADGSVAVTPALPGGLECVLAFTGYAVVATAVPAAEVLAHGPDGFGGAHSPDFLRWLAGPQGWLDSLDVTLVAHGRDAGDGSGDGRLARRDDLSGHPRVRRARRLRDRVTVYGDERGLVTLADGLGGRREISIEATQPGDRAGRTLLVDTLALVPAGAPVFAGVAPGNARSLRAFLAAGFTPIGAEVLIRPDPARRTA